MNRFKGLDRALVVIGDDNFPDPTRISPEQADQLSADILQVRAAGEDFIIDIGWLPEADQRGSYRCVIVHRNQWTSPVDSMRTRDPKEVERWLGGALEMLKRRLGVPAQPISRAADSDRLATISTGIGATAQGTRPAEPSLELSLAHA
jgi:hypothetical protein